MTTTNTYGRQVVVPLVNKSGGGVIAGDVVIVDSSNNDAFTTTTTGAYTGGIGIAQETIASNATGRVLLSGYAALVNVNASVTRGNYVKTYTVAKQGTDAGSSRIAGTFGTFLTGGTTPDAIIWQADLGGGSGMTNPMTTTGDMIYSSSGSTPARLALGAAGGAVSVINGAPAWNSGTSFPGSKATGDRYWRTDLGMEAYWDGTRWLTTQVFSLSFPPKEVLNGTLTAAINAGRLPIPYGGTWTLYIVGFEWLVVTGGTPYSSSVYWTCKLNWADAADSDTQIGSTIDSKTATTASNNYNFRDLAVATALSTNARELKLRMDPVNSPTAIVYTTGVVHYRLILT